MDTRTPEKRRQIMSSVRRRDTKPELDLRRELHSLGLRGWRCDFRAAAGRPDLAWPGLKVAVFVDGAFWHGHESRHRPGRSGTYWDQKIASNVARDRRVDAELQAAEWIVLRVWDFQIAREIERVTDRIRFALWQRLETMGAKSHWQKSLLSAFG